MDRQGMAGSRNGTGATLLLAGAVSLLALPSAVLALSSRYEALPDGNIAIETIIPGKIDPRLARSVSVRALAHGSLFRFTPAKPPSQPGREVTIAVLSSGIAHSILVRATPTQASAEPVTATPPTIAPMAYNLGVARGYKGFAPSIAARSEIDKVEMPDLASFDARGDSKAAGRPAGRLQPRIELDERASAGRAPRTFAGDGEQTVDVGGSYRVGRNLNVTAGVRYSQERDRLRPLEQGRQEGQAVYVGTQFRF